MVEDRKAEVASLIEALTADDWTQRQAAAKTLHDLGKQAAEALPALRQSLRRDGDYDVREAALRAIVAIEPDHLEVLSDVEKGLADSWAGVRSAAVQLTQELGDVVPRAPDAFWGALGREYEPGIRGMLIEMLREHFPDLTGAALQRVASDAPDQIAGGLAVLASSPPDTLDRDALTDAAPDALGLAESADAIANLSFLLFKYAAPEVIERIVLDRQDLPASRRLRLVVWDFAATFMLGLAASRPADVSRLILDGTAVIEPDIFDAEVELLKTLDLKAALDADQSEALEQTLLRAAEQGVGMTHLSLIGTPDVVVGKLLGSTMSSPPVEAILLGMSPEDLGKAWESESLRAQLLDVVAEGLDRPNWVVRQNAALFLRDHARDAIKLGQSREFVQKLERLLEREGDADVQRAARDAITTLKQAERSTRIPNLEEKLRKGDDSARIEVTQEILADPTPEATRVLAREFAILVAFGGGQIVELAGDRIRRSRDMVLPLLDQWERGLEVDDYVRDRLVERLVPTDLKDACQALFARKDVPTPQLKRLHAWILEEQSAEAAALMQNGGRSLRTTNRTLSKQIVDVLQPQLDKECEERMLVVRRTFARLLADMSDSRFFDENEEEQQTFAAIAVQLTRHAVRILGRRLADEEDITTRESIARTLASIGGREAADVLTRAIVDTERTTKTRQDLLARYYLEPSKQRSDEAAAILHGAVGAAKRTLTLLQALNVLWFLVALSLTAAGAWVAFNGGDTAEVVGGSVAGLSGVVAVIIQMLRQPLAGIQNAVTRLVQVETAFASFIWELNLNGTYIQSQYVHTGILKDEHIRQTVERIENAMHLAMSSVARYVEEGTGAVMTPRLNAISPSYASASSTIVLLGDGLNPGSRNGRTPGHIAIDHLAIAPQKLVWADDRVEFTLPDDVIGPDGGLKTVWVNVIVQGVESNALPLVAVPPGNRNNGVAERVPAPVGEPELIRPEP
jgi:hypothetical protein